MGPTTQELAELEGKVVQALDSADPSDLDVLGFGEISVVLRVATDEGEYAVKRLPPFTTKADIVRYETELMTYLDELAEAGIRVLETELSVLGPPEGPLTAYCVQPLRPSSQVGPAWLATANREDGAAVLALLVDTVCEAISPRLGVDSQLANWIVEADGTLSYLDITTPLMTDDDGEVTLDLDLFMLSLPWAMRALVKRFIIHGAIDNFHHPRSALIDAAANLNKEGLADWIPVLIDAANRRLSDNSDHSDITADEVAKYYKQDALTWATVQRLRRADAAWQRHVRRRPYPFLLPGKINR